MLVNGWWMIAIYLWPCWTDLNSIPRHYPAIYTLYVIIRIYIILLYLYMVQQQRWELHARRFWSLGWPTFNESGVCGTNSCLQSEFWPWEAEVQLELRGEVWRIVMNHVSKKHRNLNGLARNRGFYTSKSSVWPGVAANEGRQRQVVDLRWLPWSRLGLVLSQNVGGFHTPKWRFNTTTKGIEAANRDLASGRWNATSFGLNSIYIIYEHPLASVQ